MFAQDCALMQGSIKVFTEVAYIIQLNVFINYHPGDILSSLVCCRILISKIMTSNVDSLAQKTYSLGVLGI